jgi:4-amino-4-deoxy-L-arabinose transferase-like glycosyltransferase
VSSLIRLRPGRGFAAVFDNPHWCRCCAAIAAVVSVLAFGAVVPDKNRNAENTDYRYHYGPAARAILDKSSFDLSRDFRYPPGFPLMLAGVFYLSEKTHLPERHVYFLFSLLCAVVAALLVFEIGCWFWSTRGALCVSLLWAVYPLWLWSMRQPASETPFVPLLLASVLVLLDLFHGTKSAFVKSAGLGMLYGAAMLVRPVALFLPLLGAMIIIVSRRSGTLSKRFVIVLVMVVVAVAVAAPWELWMHSRTGAFLPLSENGPFSMYDGLTFAVDSDDFRQPVSVPRDVRALMDRIDDCYTRSPGMHTLSAVMADAVLHSPGAVCKLVIIKAGRSWYGTNSHRQEHGLLAVQLIYLALCLSGMVVLYKKKPEARGLCMAVVLPQVLYFWAFTILFLSIARYMVPVMPLLFVFLPANMFLLKRENI